MQIFRLDNQYLWRAGAVRSLLNIVAALRKRRTSTMNRLDLEEMTPGQMIDIGLIDGRYRKPQSRCGTAFDAARRHFMGRGL